LRDLLGPNSESDLRSDRSTHCRPRKRAARRRRRVNGFPTASQYITRRPVPQRPGVVLFCSMVLASLAAFRHHGLADARARSKPPMAMTRRLTAILSAAAFCAAASAEPNREGLPTGWEWVFSPRPL